MKVEVVEKGAAGELDAFVAASPKGHFLQTSLWGEVKNDWKWFGVICRNDCGEITGTLAVLLRKISKLPYHMMYAPRGPVCDIHDAATITALVNGAKEFGKKYDAYMLKLDADVPAEDEEYADILKSLGFEFEDKTMNFEGFQCRFVFRINLNGRSEDEVFASFHSKHRYNIRVALKHGVEVRICGSEKAAEFYDIMKETCERDGFALRSAEYFGRILDVFGENARLYMAYYEGAPIAGALAVYYGDKLWYFYGASLGSHRNVMPNYLLQWEMIRWAIEKGCRIYDFRGVSGIVDETSPLYGLYRFKKGFNGDLIEFAGEADLITKPAAAKIVGASQGIMKKIRK